MTVESYVEWFAPLRKTVTIRRRTAAEAFEVFTTGISRWWPLDRYSIDPKRARTCVLEPRVGGEVYEVNEDGERAPWGRVLVFEPPARLVVTWHPGREPQTAQEVEVRFSDAPEGVLVELEHRGWAALGDEARTSRPSYSEGWDHVLGTCFRDAAEGGRSATPSSRA
jgi:uncharacterized protein YndB with AHSA1/START domain